MFKEARIKLTVWYLAIIMAISFSFSGVIYVGINQELTRIENFQRVRIQRIIINYPQIFENPVPPEIDAIAEARRHLIFTLGLVNLAIFILSGGAGYFLAGRTLEPIRKNMEEQKAFISDASHELRTPLTSLKTEIEVSLRDKGLSLTNAKSLLKSNLEDVDRMQRLSNYLLKMNRYERGNNLTMEKINLKNVAVSAIGKLDIKTDLKDAFVTGNFDSLVELVAILIDNAIKYGEGKEILVSSKSLRSVGSMVHRGEISVTDHGVGIANEDLPHIFDRFYRSDKSRGTEGYGLGLSIAKQIAEINGGVIHVKSSPGKGSTFTVAL